MDARNLFMPEDTNERGGRVVTMDIPAVDVSEVDEAHNIIKLEGVAVDYDDPGKGAMVWLEFMGNQIKLPRAIGNIRIIIEEA